MHKLQIESPRDIKTIGPMLKQILESENYQPPLLPEIALSLTEVANRPDVEIKEVEEAIRRDPTVATRVVAVANSAFFSRGKPISSIKLAVTRLGLAAIRDIAFQVVAKTKIFRVPAYSAYMRDLFDTALAAGLITRETCRLLSFESDMAYLCGLLHDMGEAIILGILGEIWSIQGMDMAPVEMLRPVLDALHPVAGARVCEKWKMPQLISDAIRYHHEPEKGDQVSQMSLVVAVGDVLLRHAGIGRQARPVDPLQEPLFYRLNLIPQQVARLLKFAESLAKDPDLAASLY